MLGNLVGVEAVVLVAVAFSKVKVTLVKAKKARDMAVRHVSVGNGKLRSINSTNVMKLRKLVVK